MLSLIISTLSIRMFAIFLRWGSSLNIIQNISITEAYTKSVFLMRLKLMLKRRLELYQGIKKMELHTFYFSLSINVRLGHCSRDD